MEELKKCPFCSGEEIAINRIYINPISETLVNILPDEVNVTCVSCGLGGYTEETEEEAVEAWNQRKGA